DVSALAEDSNGTIWIASWSGGITSLNPESGRMQIFSATALAADQFHVLTLYAASNGDIWAGAWTGAYVLHPGRANFERILPSALQTDYVNAFAEDTKGTIWCGGASGLGRLSGPSPRHFKRNDGLFGTEISKILALPDDSLLISYESQFSGIER